MSRRGEALGGQEWLGFAASAFGRNISRPLRYCPPGGQTSHAEGGLFNLGCGEARTWIELATANFTALGKEPNIEFIDMPEHLQSKYQYHTCADIAKLRGSGFTTDIKPLTQAVRDYVQGYLVPDKRLGDEVG